MLKPKGSHSSCPPSLLGYRTQTKKWPKPGEFFSSTETSHSHVVETPIGVSQRSRNTRYSSRHKSSTRVQPPDRTTEVIRIAAKPPGLQPTAQPTDISRATTKSPNHHHTTPAVLSNKLARSTNEAFINVQSDVPQLQSVIKASDKPIRPQSLAIIIKPVPGPQLPNSLTLHKRIQAAWEDPAEWVN